MANGNGREGIGKVPFQFGSGLFRTPVGVISGVMLLRLVAF